MIQTKLVFLIIKTKFISISYLYETSMILNVFMEAKNTHAHTDTIIYTHKRVQTKITLTVELEGKIVVISVTKKKKNKIDFLRLLEKHNALPLLAFFSAFLLILF